MYKRQRPSLWEYVCHATSLHGSENAYSIGMAIAKAMAANGATIVFNDIKQELVDKGLAAYEEAGIKAHGYVCDVTSEEQVNAMVAQIEKEVGVIDILVNNAGIIKRIPMCDMTAEQFRQVIDVDLNAPLDRKSTRLNSSHSDRSRMPSSA